MDEEHPIPRGRPSGLKVECGRCQQAVPYDPTQSTAMCADCRVEEMVSMDGNDNDTTSVATQPDTFYSRSRMRDSGPSAKRKADPQAEGEASKKRVLTNTHENATNSLGRRTVVAVEIPRQVTEEPRGFVEEDDSEDDSEDEFVDAQEELQPGAEVQDAAKAQDMNDGQSHMQSFIQDGEQHSKEDNEDSNEPTGSTATEGSEAITAANEALDILDSASSHVSDQASEDEIEITSENMAPGTKSKPYLVIEDEDDDNDNDNDNDDKPTNTARANSKPEHTSPEAQTAHESKRSPSPLPNAHNRQSNRARDSRRSVGEPDLPGPPDPVNNLSPHYTYLRDFHNRAKALIPRLPLEEHRYWIGVLNVGRAPKSFSKEKHFVWMKGNRYTTVSTVWYTYHNTTATEDFVLLLGLEKVEFVDKMEELDYFNEKKIMFRAVDKKDAEARGRALSDGAIPRERVEQRDVIEIDG